MVESARIRNTLVFASLAFILAATLVPTGGAERPFGFCVLCSDRAAADAIVNILLFLPLGASLASVSARPLAVVVAALLLSTSIEVTQALAIAGRDGNFGDIVFNTIGASVGVAAMSRRRFWVDPAPLRAAWLGAAAIVFAIGVVLLTGYFTRISLPDRTWFGQWTPQFGGMGYYDGRVLEASAGAEGVPSQRLADDGALRRNLLAGVPLVVRATVSPPPPLLATIFSIADDEQRFALLLGADGQDLGLYMGRRATDARLFEPLLRYPNALAAARVGDTIGLEVVRAGNRVCFGPQAAVRCDLDVTAGMGWQLLATWDRVRRRTAWLDAVWLGLLLVPAGYWLGLRWPAGVAVALVLGGAPWAAGLRASPSSEWIGAIVGVIAGTIIRRAVGSRSRIRGDA